MKATEAREATLKKRKEFMKNIYEQIDMKARSGSFYLNWSVDGGFLTEEYNELIESGFTVELDTIAYSFHTGTPNIINYTISWYPEREYTK